MPFSRFATDPVVPFPSKANVRPGMLALLHQAAAALLGGQAWRGAIEMQFRGTHDGLQPEP